MDDEIEDGEFVEIDGEDESVVDTEDGGALVTIDEPRKADSAFYDNLAEELPERELDDIGRNLIELLTRDKEARSKRDEQYEEGIRRTGLGDDAPGGAQFQGASRVVHPMLTEVCVDFSSRAIKELFPADGPVKMNIVGPLTKGRVSKARRKSEYMNWQLTTQSQEFRSELEQLLTQVPLGGAQYMKITWDEARNRPNFLFVAIDDMYLPYAATNFYTSQRKTHVQYLTELDYKHRVKNGMYRDIDLVPPSALPDQSKAEQANDKIEGRSDNAYNEDGLRTVFEIYTYLDIEEEGETAPYVVSVDKTSGKVLSLYRNWDEDDPTQEELQWIVEFPFVPWRGAYPIGIVHMIGGLSAAATGALRALLDSAHISNSQTMLKLKGGSSGGQSLNIQPTQVEEIEGGLNVDDVRKIAMPLPFNPPSGVLYQLLGTLGEMAKGMVRTTMDDISESNQNVPVGTTLAKIEQGMVVFSAIHGRLHNAMGRMLRILHRLNGMYLDDEAIEQETGAEITKRSDFTGPMDVVPVSDPNIFSEAQRFAQVQAVAQRAQLLPQLYNLRKVEERVLETLKIPNPKDLMSAAIEPQEQNAVAENVALSMARPVVAFPEQDHIAHLKTHLAYLVSPALGRSQLVAPSFLPGVLNHLKEHIALWYASQVFDTGTMALGMDLGEAVKQAKTPEAKREVDRLLAEASMNVAMEAETVFQSLPPVVQEAIKALQELSPPPQDPTVAAAMADIAQRKEATQGKLQIDGGKLELEKAKLQGSEREKQLEAQLEEAAIRASVAEAQLKEQAENQRAMAELRVRKQMNDDDNRVAKEIVMMEIGSREKVAVSQNPNPNQDQNQDQNSNPNPSP
jgi:hypothetical protein